MLGLFEVSLIGVVFILVFIILLPLILALIVGGAFANLLGFTGLTYWAFVLLFALIVASISGKIGA